MMYPSHRQRHCSITELEMVRDLVVMSDNNGSELLKQWRRGLTCNVSTLALKSVREREKLMKFEIEIGAHSLYIMEWL